MVVNEHTIITMDLLFVETRPRQNWEKKRSMKFLIIQDYFINQTSP